MKLGTHRVVFTVFLLSYVSARAADQAALETQMRQTLKDHILGLAMPYTAPDLKFDASGNLIGSSAVGPWTVNGSIQVDNVSVKTDSFEIDGERVILMIANGKTNTPTPALSGRKAHISLLIAPPIDDAKIRAALGNVFSGQNVEQRFNAYWKSAGDLDKPCKAIAKDHPDGVVGTLADNPVYGCVKANVVTKPKSISTPAPGAGSKKEIEGHATLGLVIDETGSPAVLKAKTASKGDYGLAALQAVSQWKYAPAMKDGKAVPYLMDVELGSAFADGDKD